MSSQQTFSATVAPNNPSFAMPMTAAVGSGDAGPWPAPSRRSSGLGWVSIALSLLLALASIGLADSRQVWAQLRAVDARWLAAAFIVGLLQLAVLGLRWSRVATKLGLHLGWLRASGEYALSVLGNQVLPTGVAGDGLRVLRQTRNRRGGQTLPAILEAVALDRVSGQIALWLIVFATAPLTVAAGIVNVSSLALSAGLIGAGGLSAWMVASRVPRWQGHVTGVRRLFYRAARFLVSPRGAAVHLPLSLLLVIFTLFQLYIAARAIGIALPWLQLFWLGPLILVAASIPSFFGGWGIREGASALLFAAAGMSESTGVAVSLVYGSFALVISLPSVLVLWFDTSRPASAGPDIGATPQQSA